MLQVQIEITRNVFSPVPTQICGTIGMTVDITDVCTDAAAIAERVVEAVSGTHYADSLDKRPACITVCADDEVWRQLPWLETMYTPFSQLVTQETCAKIAVMVEACELADYAETYLAYCAHYGSAVPASDCRARSVVDVPGGDLEGWAETLITEVSSIPDFVLPYIAFDALSRDLLSTDYTSFVDEATDMTYVYRR